MGDSGVMRDASSRPMDASLPIPDASRPPPRDASQPPPRDASQPPPRDAAVPIDAAVMPIWVGSVGMLDMVIRVNAEPIAKAVFVF